MSNSSWDLLVDDDFLLNFVTFTPDTNATVDMFISGSWTRTTPNLANKQKNNH